MRIGIGVGWAALLTVCKISFKASATGEKGPSTGVDYNVFLVDKGIADLGWIY